MITNLKLTNFRGIKEGELELAPLTILLGGNNSAKSTILETLFLAPNPFRRVPYRVGDDTAAGVIQSTHETLNSAGYAFLLYNYTAQNAEIRCIADGEEHLIRFVVQPENPETVLVSTNKVTGAKSIVIIAGKEEKVNPVGSLNMSIR